MRARKRLNPTLYIRPAQLAARWGVHRTSLWRWIKRGDLPRPTRLGPKTVAWPVKVIEAFEAAWS